MPVDDATLKEGAKDFYLKEYKSLRKEIEWLLKDYRDLERNVVIAVGVTLGWLFDKRADVPWQAWFLSFLFAALGAIRATGILQAFRNFKNYIFEVEEAFSNEGDPKGWEHFHRRKGSTARFAARILDASPAGDRNHWCLPILCFIERPRQRLLQFVFKSAEPQMTVKGHRDLLTRTVCLSTSFWLTPGPNVMAWRSSITSKNEHIEF